MKMVGGVVLMGVREENLLDDSMMGGFLWKMFVRRVVVDLVPILIPIPRSRLLLLLLRTT